MSSSISCNGETFTKTDYNGVSILVRDSDGYVNATWIVRESGNQSKRDHFGRFIKGDRWQEICDGFDEIYCSAENGGAAKQPYYTLNEGISTQFNEVRGTYVHPKLIHYTYI